MNEAFAVILLFNSLKNNKKHIYKEYMYIHVDSLPLLNLLRGNSFPKYDSMKKLIEQIYVLLNIIINNNMYQYIYFKKVKSHSNILGNNLVDKLAKIAAKACKYNDKYIQYIPFQITMAEIYRIQNIKKNYKWINRKEKNRNYIFNTNISKIFI